MFAEYTVRFDGDEIPAQTVRSGQKVTPVDDPVREGYVFAGWYQDANLTQPWDLEQDKVQSDLTLYAAWDRDTGDEITVEGNDKDFSALRTPGSQE